MKYILGAFSLMASVMGFAASSAKQPDVIAIGVLFEPNESLVKQAIEINGQLRKNYPAGFALGINHVPHITVLQCFVRSNDLAKVKVAVAKVVAVEKPTNFHLTANGLSYSPLNTIGAVSINIAPTPELLNFQQKIIVALTPFIVKQGTAAAFIANENGMPIQTFGVDYVNAFVPLHSGKNYVPHITLGLGSAEFAKKMLSKPFDPLTITIRAVSIYWLGDYGTARKKL